MTTEGALTTDQMTGRRLKGDRGYVFVQIPPDSTKHMFVGEQPTAGDFTACGQKVLGHFLWAQAALALVGDYCRECERIWRQS